MKKETLLSCFIVLVIIVGLCFSWPIGWNVVNSTVVFLDNGTRLPLYFAVQEEHSERNPGGFVFPDNPKFQILALDWDKNPTTYSTVIIRGLRTSWEKTHLIETKKLFSKNHHKSLEI